WTTPRFPVNMPRLSTAWIAPKGLTRFCNAMSTTPGRTTLQLDIRLLSSCRITFSENRLPLFGSCLGLRCIFSTLEANVVEGLGRDWFLPKGRHRSAPPRGREAIFDPPAGTE